MSAYRAGFRIRTPQLRSVMMATTSLSGLEPGTYTLQFEFDPPTSDRICLKLVAHGCKPRWCHIDSVVGWRDCRHRHDQPSMRRRNQRATSEAPEVAFAPGTTGSVMVI